MNTVQRIAKNTGVIIAGNIVNKAISLVVVIFLARYLGTAGYGKYAFVFAFLMFFGIITDLGINTILVREISRDKSLASKYIGNAAIMKLILSLSAVVLAMVVITILPYPADTMTYIYIMSLTLLFGSFSGLYSTMFQVNLKMEYSVVANLIDRILSASVILCIIFFHGSLLQIMIALMFSNLIGLLVTYLYSKNFVRMKFEIDFDLWKFFVKESWPLALTAIFITIYWRIDQIMLSMMQGDVAVGYYAAAVNLTEIFGIIPSAFAISVFPLISEYFKTSKSLHEKMYQLSFKYMVMIIIPIAMGTMLLAKPTVRLIFGEQFLPSASALQILMWSNVFAFIGVINKRILISANKQKIDFVFTSTSAIVNIILNLLLIPIYGIVGAGIATAISYGVGPVMGFFLSATRDYSISAFRSMVEPVVASLVMSVYIYYVLSSNLLWSIITAPILYFGVLFLIKGITREDIEMIKGLTHLREVA